MNALENLIVAYTAAADDSGPGPEASLIAAARAEQAELVEALRGLEEVASESNSVGTRGVQPRPGTAIDLLDACHKARAVLAKHASTLTTPPPQ